jgi:hypothetical protein
MTMADEENERPATHEAEHWTIDRRIPLALIFALVAQAVAAVWYVSGLEGRVKAAGDAVAELARSDIAQDTRLGVIDDRTTRIEVDYNTTKVEVSRRLSGIESKLDRIIERLAAVRGRSTGNTDE